MSNEKVQKFLKILRVIILLLYPFLIFFALQYRISFKLISLIFLGTILLNYQRSQNKILLCIGMLICCLIYCYKYTIFLKIYPVIMNCSVLVAFACSLRKKPLITVFAEKMKVCMTKEKLEYTRKATRAWAYFMLFLSILSFSTIFMSDFIWMIFNGFISYVLIGCMFCAEWLVRKKRKYV